MEIVTGSTGQVHVTSVDDAVRNSNVGYLNKRVVFTWLENFSATILNNNQVRINSGYGINQGRIFKIDENEFDVVNIDSGSQGYKRVDIIAARYTMNTQSGFENIELVVIKGESRNSYIDPTYSTGNINRGATLDDMPMYRVKLNGLTIEAVERMFTLEPDGGRIGQLEKKVSSNLYTNLASETAGKLTGATNVDIGIKGTLAIAHGGTGATTAHGGFNALANGAAANTTTPADADVIVTKAGGTWYQKTFSTLWNYIAAKVRSLLGITNASTNIIPVGHGGTGLSTIGANKMLVGTGNTSFGTKTLVTAMLDASAVNDSNIPTTKAVSDAMSNRGYGDMLSSYYATTVAGTTTKVIAVNRGGTGATTADAARANLVVPPKNHASTATTYGIGNASNYGHVKLTDSYTSTSAASSGVAASAKALKSLHDIMPNYDSTIAKLQEDIEYIEDSYMSKGGGTFTGNIAVAVGGTTGRLTLGNSTETPAPSGKGSTGHLRIYCDYTARADVYANSDMNGSKTIILPRNGGTLALDTSSSRRVKENIKDMTEERAKKILDLDVVNFDYIGDFGGGLKDQSGVIAEDVIKIIPEAVDIAKRYDETKPIDERTNPAPSVDYRKFVPYLIKMVQMQQKEIDALKKLNNIE